MMGEGRKMEMSEDKEKKKRMKNRQCLLCLPIYTRREHHREK